MWKKLLISSVTFIAGLYFFLEYMVPPTVPWQTLTGVLASRPTAKEMSIRTYGATRSVPVDSSTVAVRHIPASDQNVAPLALRPGDQVTVNKVSGEVSGVPTEKNIDVKTDGKITSVKVDADTAIVRHVAASDENVAPVALRSGDQVTVNGVSGEVSGLPTAKGVDIRIYGPERTIKLSGNSLIYSHSGGSGYAATTWDALNVGEPVKVGPTTYLSQWQTTVNDFLIVLAALAWGMGLISLWMVHSTNIRKRRPEWYLSVFLFMAIVFGALAGYGFGQKDGTTLKNLSDVVFQYLLIPMGSTVFSLLTFYMASAAYRSFKAKSGEAVLMMVSALIIMMGQIPVGLWLTKWMPPSIQMPVVSQWILYLANSAAVNGMWFGMMLGAIAVGLRFWLSLERGAFFDQEL